MYKTADRKDLPLELHKSANANTCSGRIAFPLRGAELDAYRRGWDATYYAARVNAQIQIADFRDYEGNSNVSVHRQQPFVNNILHNKIDLICSTNQI